VTDGKCAFAKGDLTIVDQSYVPSEPDEHLLNACHEEEILLHLHGAPTIGCVWVQTSKDLQPLGSNGRWPMSFHQKRLPSFQIPGMQNSSELQVMLAFLTRLLSCGQSCYQVLKVMTR